MKILISGVCGFIGSELALGLRREGHRVAGFDNFSRPGSKLNHPRILEAGVEFFQGDARFEKDLANAEGFDWVIDAAANPSVLAGVDGKTGSRELLEHNLWGTVNLLELCKRESAGLILLSTSRVYSIANLKALPLSEQEGAFALKTETPSAGPMGIREDFPTSAPISLYGASKLASEQIALEYGDAFNFPVWINRCGVIAGAGQFGKPDQGIFSFWIHSWACGAPLRYIGFGGSGHQVRDCLHPSDLLNLILLQMEQSGNNGQTRRIFNIGGGRESSVSLQQLSEWCTHEFGPREVGKETSPRPFDLPWVVLDASQCRSQWNWTPRRTVWEICAEIASHARKNPDWLAASSPTP
jgi:CDP-paratose 2-epimerase